MNIKQSNYLQLLLKSRNNGIKKCSPHSYIGKSDEEKQDDTTYRLRYVIPAATGVAVIKVGYVLRVNTSIGC